MPDKDCGNHESRRQRRLCGLILGWMLGFAVLILFIVLVIFLVLRPTKPRFYLHDASVYQFNLSSGPAPSLLTAVIQVTVSSRNPNDRIGVLYDRLDVYAAYKSQQVTMATAIPPLYQGHGDVDVWSPYLYGSAVPIAPYLGAAMMGDEAAGFILLHVRMDGRVRWKVGSWISGQYHIDISCPAFLTFPNGGGGRGDGGDGGDGGGFSAPFIRFQQLVTCSVEV